MPQYTSRAAAAFAWLSAELYRNGKQYAGPGRQNPFVLLAGPEVLRLPQLGQYLDHTTLHEIYATMHGQEDMYIQMHDLLLLLELQCDPITLEERHTIALWFQQQWEIQISPNDIVSMTEREYWAAIERLTAFVAAKVPDQDIVKYLGWHVPLVLNTAHLDHSMRAAGKAIRFKPMKMTPHQFVWWFKDRLLRAVKIRLERYPHNPLWMLPDGEIQGSQIAIPQHYRELAEYLDLLCTPVHRGRPLGRKNMPEAEFQQRYSEEYQRLLDTYETKPRRYEVADALHMDVKTFRTYLKDCKLPFPPF